MEQRQCTNCDEMVDVSKAFCPACGKSMDAEERRKITAEFDKLEETIHFSDTGYELLKKKMDLDTTDSSDETKPLQEPQQYESEHETRNSSNEGNMLRKLIFGVAILILLLVIVLIVILVAIFLTPS